MYKIIGTPSCTLRQPWVSVHQIPELTINDSPLLTAQCILQLANCHAQWETSQGQTFLKCSPLSTPYFTWQEHLTQSTNHMV